METAMVTEDNADPLAQRLLMQERFDSLRDKIATAYKNVPEEEGLAEIDALVREERGR